VRMGEIGVEYGGEQFVGGNGVRWALWWCYCSVFNCIVGGCRLARLNGGGCRITGIRFRERQPMGSENDLQGRGRSRSIES
jgi:hypothetical protein